MHTTENVRAFAMLLCIVSLQSTAQLTVKTAAYGSRPGYIDEATLVVQPHGAYVEQSLYMRRLARERRRCR